MPKRAVATETFWIQGCRVEYYRSFLSKSKSQVFFELLLEETPWIQSEVRIFGKTYPIPRMNAWYGEKSYRYSGTVMEACPFTESIQQLAERLETVTGDTYNAVLLNLYRDGRDTMGWHSDDEPELDASSSIASISLGGSRRFLLRSKGAKQESGTEKLEFHLDDGDLLVMYSPTQEYTQHSIPRSQKWMDPRLNLTFRKLL